MLCDFCHECEAEIFIEQKEPAGKFRINMCRSCADERGINENSDKSTILNFIKDQLDKRKAEDKKVCPVCGTSLNSIELHRIAGCSECYAIFQGEILKIQQNQGVHSPYVGTMPKRLKGFRSVLTDRTLVQAKLQESIKTEDYEKAAFYRDYLKAIEKTAVTGEDYEK